MGYAEARVAREVKNLAKELVQSRERERQTRQGCLELVEAIKGIVAKAGSCDDPAGVKIGDLVEQAERLLAPDAERTDNDED